MKKILAAAALVGLALGSAPASAQDSLVTFKIMSLDTAQVMAQSALDACRKAGFQVSVAVVDRFGNAQVLLRDRFAGPHTPDTARRKAWTAVSFRAVTSELAELTTPGKPQSGARDIAGALMLGGGLPVEAGGSIVGGIGVSGAPGGQEDEICAQAGIDAVRARLEF